MKRIKVDIVTAVDGTATVLSPAISGKVHSISYLKDAGVPFVDGVDFAVTSALTGENIWTEANVNASTVRYPRAATHSNVGAAALYAVGGAPVQDKIGLANDKIKVVLAQGGSTKKGQLVFLLD